MILKASHMPHGIKQRAGERLETTLVERLLDVQAAGLLVIMALALLCVQLVWPDVPAFVLPTIFLCFGLYIVGRNVPDLIRLDRDLSVERRVGETLDTLVASGARILHDVPFGSLKIDHVVVTKQGLFVIETRHLKLMRNDTGLLRYHQGRLLKSTGAVKGAPEARVLKNTHHISDILNASGHDLQIDPVLILPGWSLTGNRDSDEPRVFDTSGFLQWLNAQPALYDAGMIRETYQILRTYADRHGPRDSRPNF